MADPLSSEVIARIEAEVPGENGFWKSRCRDTFHAEYSRLRSQGETDDEAIDHLAELYHAVAGEYGD